MCGPWFGSWGMFSSMLVPILILAAVIYLIVRGLGGRCNFYSERHDQRGERPLDILKSRYAKGEISQEDFDRMRREIEQ